MAADRGELSPQAEQRIIDVIHSLIDDQVDRGVDLNRPMRCDSCEQDKNPRGSTQYGSYTLCNDCLLEFTILLASGEIENVAQYMTRRPDDPDNSGPSPEQLDTRSVHSLSTRTEKLTPSTEPC